MSPKRFLANTVLPAPMKVIFRFAVFTKEDFDLEASRPPHLMFSLCYRWFHDLAGEGMIAKHLANDFFNGLLFYAEVVNFAVRKNHAADLRNFVALNLQLYGGRSPFDHFS